MAAQNYCRTLLWCWSLYTMMINSIQLMSTMMMIVMPISTCDVMCYFSLHLLLFLHTIFYNFNKQIHFYILLSSLEIFLRKNASILCYFFNMWFIRLTWVYLWGIQHIETLNFSLNLIVFFAQLSHNNICYS